jgi:hypothetical protein
MIGKVDSLSSGILGEMRPYLVYTPPSYNDTTATPQHYPVLYILDGDAHFHSVTGLIQIPGTGVNGTYVVPEMIVVAIPNTDRMRDMTPTNTEIGFDGKPQPGFRTSGGMPAFLRFIERADPTRRVAVPDHALPNLRRAFTGWDHDAQRPLHNAADVPCIRRHRSQPLLGSADDAAQSEGILSFARLEGKALYLAQAFRFIFDGYSVPLLQVIDQPGLLLEHFRSVSARIGATFSPSEGMVRQLAQITLTRDTAKANRNGRGVAGPLPGEFPVLRVPG